SSQIKAHQEYGGVVPFLAARLHTKKLPPLVIKAIQDFREQTSYHSFSAIAVTNEPGLEPALYTGVNQANVLSTALDVPIYGINHLHGHIWSYLAPTEGNTISLDEHRYPFLALVVSGGHTILVLVHAFGNYEVLGQTIDDAAGEAFDKVASMLNLGYPGGPVISQRAQDGNSEAINFPRPLSKQPNLNVSFSGLKTSVLYYLKEKGGVYHLSEQEINDIAASFQQAVIDTLMIKVNRVLNKYDVQQLVLGGGVAANPELRKAMEQSAKKYRLPMQLPASHVTGDNALMIGIVAALAKQNADKGDTYVRVNPSAGV
ncbi:MAG: tRNA (adenosine(37)-N6)-threonylcarbamoyltransferase complex transferase subunit TsaD, partial [Candidatus Paceibacteria bacterium]